MIPLLAGAGPRWFNIPAHRPFVHDLARGLFDALAPLGQSKQREQMKAPMILLFVCTGLVLLIAAAS